MTVEWNVAQGRDEESRTGVILGEYIESRIPFLFPPPTSFPTTHEGTKFHVHLFLYPPSRPNESEAIRNCTQ